MKARYVQVEKANAPLELVTREVPEPKAGDVRVRVEACGVCHSDSVTVEGLFPIVTYPRPSHPNGDDSARPTPPGPWRQPPATPVLPAPLDWQ